MSTHNGSGHLLDVRLMRMLDLLVRERSVSRTAVILGQSQPSVSLALRQLREVLHDPILVRSGMNLVPTERGIELSARARMILEEIEGLCQPSDVDDPGTVNRNVRIVSDNCLGPILLPQLVLALRAEAPNLTIEFCGIAREDDIFFKMESGDLDLVVANWPAPRENFRFMPLLEQDMVVIARRNHPLLGASPLAMETYLSLEHLSPTPNETAPISPVDGRLAQLGKSRNIALTVPDFGLISGMLQKTDLAFTCSAAFAHHLSGPDLATVKAPAEFGPMKFYMLWHERTHRSAFSRWLRGLVKKSVVGIS